MFIGDSVTRYQYLNLAHFVATGEWDSPADLPNENKRRFGDWARFHAETNCRLGGREVCDCYRNGSDLASVVENRYFEDPAGVRLSFFIVHADQPFRQHALPRLNVTCNGAFPDRYATLCRFARRAAPCAQAFCAPGACRPRRLEDTEPGEYLQHRGAGGPQPAGSLAALVRALLQSDVVVNAGLHWRDGAASRFTVDSVRARLQAEAEALRRAGAAARLHWKTTTAVRDGWPFSGGPAEYPFAAQLVEAWALTHALRLALEDREVLDEGYWDGLHLHGPVYAQLNRVLIAYLCSLPPCPRLARLRDLAGPGPARG
jgi:hypothetical protein